MKSIRPLLGAVLLAASCVHPRDDEIPVDPDRSGGDAASPTTNGGEGGAVSAGDRPVQPGTDGAAQPSGPAQPTTDGPAQPTQSEPDAALETCPSASCKVGDVECGPGGGGRTYLSDCGWMPVVGRREAMFRRKWYGPLFGRCVCGRFLRSEPPPVWRRPLRQRHGSEGVRLQLRSLFEAA